jgi:hypothetical protein
VAAGRDDPAVVQHQDVVGEAHRRQAVRDQQGRPARGQLTEASE